MKKLPLINLIAFLMMAIVNFLAANRIIWKHNLGDVAHFYDNMFTPADYTFSIWSIIYLAIGFFILKDYQNRNKEVSKEVKTMGYLFVLTCFFNIAWIMAWLAYSIEWSLFFIFGLWATLAFLYYQLAITKARLLYTLPISLYLGWIAVSFIANFNVFLIDIDYAYLGMAQEKWTTILISVTIIGGLLMQYWNQDILFNLVLIWALVGAYSKNYHLDNEMILTLVIGIFTLAFVAILVGWRKVYPSTQQQKF